jgi:hypothetical protein
MDPQSGRWGAPHGIGQQHKGEDVLLAEWAPALRDGIRRASQNRLGDALADREIRIAFYGDLFRPPGRPLNVGDPWLAPEDMTNFERELLVTWWQDAATSDRAVISSDAQTLTPRSVQAALRALSNSRFFAGIAERGLLFDLRQVSHYFSDPAVRRDAQDRVAAAVGEDEVRVLIGHSLGSVVAYEALCAHPEWPVRALVTLGSPLGIKNLIFDRLQPSGGCWPGPVRAWTNVADAGDVVALVKDLRSHPGHDHSRGQHRARHGVAHAEDAGDRGRLSRPS